MIESRLLEITGLNCESRPEAQSLETTETGPLDLKANQMLDLGSKTSK